MNIDVLTKMKQELVPQGSAPLVRLFLNPATYFDATFVAACISELAKLEMSAVLGCPPSPLQRLAAHVLIDSAYITLEKEIKS